MGQRLERLCLTLLGAGLVVLMLAIVLQVICSALDVNPVLSFAHAHAFVGDAITLNSLLDLQWHLLVICGLLPAGLVWITNRHVRVDFLYEGRSDKTKARINLLGNLLFAAPFLALALPASWAFMQRAWRSGEASSNGGLNDLWLIKAVLPLGLGLLTFAIVVETIRILRHVR
ncbi:TRAP transporter small permease subunit [uncultured Aliiroseovarius sp.]|uniref:TRAP transporter small permease subunit n=1 Tax=uncultured Aliiroseovarius sp. TaxID=1658783 RepID=UPI00261AF615|nr:TRAP transporter small permease subunit [uncultured Aliiroseovarius sp.]